MVYMILLIAFWFIGRREIRSYILLLGRHHYGFWLDKLEVTIPDKITKSLYSEADKIRHGALWMIYTYQDYLR